MSRLALITLAISTLVATGCAPPEYNAFSFIDQPVGETEGSASEARPFQGVSWSVISPSTNLGDLRPIDLTKPGQAWLFRTDLGPVDLSAIQLVDQDGAEWQLDTFMEAAAEEAGTSVQALTAGGFSLVGVDTAVTGLTDAERDALTEAGALEQADDQSERWVHCGYVVSGGRVVGLVFCWVGEPAPAA